VYVNGRWLSTSSAGNPQQPQQRRRPLPLVEDCLMFADRVVVPTSPCLLVARQFHMGRPGASRMSGRSQLCLVVWDESSS
ncbi:hypothetical protein PHET_11615, partial [Paragonimus heterotremus]